MTRRPSRSTAAEPLTKKLTWDIKLQSVQVEAHTVPNHQAIIRNDNQEVLSITKKSYHPATNEKFLEVIGRLHEFTGFTVEGFSIFQGGRKVLAFLQNNEKMRVADFDCSNYLVVGNSFDCSSGFYTGISTVLIRCTNQFSRMNLKQNIRHDNQINIKLDGLIRFYKEYVNQENQLKKTFEVWNQMEVDQRTIEKFVDEVLEIPNDNVSTLKRNNKERLYNSINTEIAAMGNNAYGLFNGLTHYTTHVVKSSNKVFGNLLGHPYRLNERGYSFLNELVTD